jgi:hypothetical protein
MWRVISHQPWRPGARSWGHDQWIAPIKMSARAERPARATRHLVQNARPRFISSLTYSTVAMGRCFAFFDASAENFSGTSKPASVGGRSRTSPERTPAIARAISRRAGENRSGRASLPICAVDLRKFIRRCEPVHIEPARLVPPSTGAPQRGREKCVPSFLPSRLLRPSWQLA